VIHGNQHPLAGCNVKLMSGVEYHIEDWYDRIHGTPHATSDYQIAIDYAARRHGTEIPDDDNVVYGWYMDGTEALINVVEIDDVQ
jgi:hypothetical protein